jgi:hypothetical protein
MEIEAQVAKTPLRTYVAENKYPPHEQERNQMKTFRRDKLRRLVEAGRVVTVATYHFDDMTGESRTHRPMKVAMLPADFRERQQGICYMFKHDFTAKSGCCYVRNEADGIITLIVHSNSKYDLRILPA